MAQFTSPYANMSVPLYTDVSRREQQDYSDLNHRAYHQMARVVSMDGLEVALRAKESVEKSYLAANRFSAGFSK